MADGYQAVALGIKPPDPNQAFESMGNILGLQSKRLGLQQQAQALDIQAQTLQQQQLATQQQQGVNQFFNDWSPGDHIGADGTTDIDSAHGSDAYKALTGNARLAVDKHLIDIKKGQIDNASNLVGLGTAGVGALADAAGSLAQDADVVAGNENGKAKVQAAFDKTGQIYGPAGAKAALTYKGITDGDLKDGELPQRLIALQKQAITTQQRLALTAPGGTTVQGRSGLNVINTNPYAGQPVGSKVGQSVTDQGIAPGLVTAPNQQLAVNSPSGTLRAAGEGTAGINPSGVQQKTNEALAAGVTDRVKQAQAAANGTVQTQDALNRMKAILESPNAPTTGPGFDWKTQARTLFAGAGFDTNATSANELVKNMARYEAARATQAGLGGTDAARDLSHHGSPNASVDNDALLGIVRQSLATEKAVGAYAKIQAGVSDPNKLAANESAFRNIPHLIETYEYTMQRNPAEAEKYLRDHQMTHKDVTSSAAALKALGAM